MTFGKRVDYFLVERAVLRDELGHRVVALDQAVDRARGVARLFLPCRVVAAIRKLGCVLCPPTAER